MDKRDESLLLAAALLLALSSILFALAILSGCAPLPTGQANSSQVDPDTVRSVPVPDWAAQPVGQWLNMDWDLWSCPRAKGC